MNVRIALLKGDGIGTEIVDSAVSVLEKIGEKILEETGKGVTVTVRSGSPAENYLQKNYPDVRITIHK